MTQLEKVLYTTAIHTVGARDGTSCNDDGELDIKLLSPGTRAARGNPERRFAVVWSGCFLEAIKVVAGEIKSNYVPTSLVAAEVDLGSMPVVSHRTRQRRRRQRQPLHEAMGRRKDAHVTGVA
jgi:organic hydroperoxide reductase OsmC/OhrA